eukprot:Polyplicarium_translucidae@DN2734_c0_g2_i1.p2
MFLKLPGLDQAPLRVDVANTDKFACVRQRVAEATGIPAETLRFTNGLQEPSEDLTVEENEISADSVLTISFELLGGAKKRKKKQYTKPKKIKHKKKKIKLHVLRFYKVDGNEKLTRQRKICATCGPGVFMATHADRTYCGRCSVANFVKQAAE